MENKLFKQALVIVIIFLLSTIFSGCTEEKIIKGIGKIRYIDIEGGFYGIISDDGENYIPLNLPNEFKQDYLNISFKIITINNQFSPQTWGKKVYIIKIEKIEVNGNLTGYTDCKEFLNDNLSSNKDCIEYNYNNEKILEIKHVNACFNCCPEIIANITITGNIIKIKEIEISADCECLCLYDLNYEIHNLSGGEYLITVDEPYLLENDQILEFTVNLTNSPSGSYCADRNHYPWE